VCGLADETIARLAEIPQCIGLEDATGDVTRPLRLRALVGSDFRLLSGDDATALAFLAQGGDGCISVTSNAAPGLCRALYLAWRQGEIARAQQLAAAVARLAAALSRESNPAPLKYALSLMELISPRVRLPLVELKAETKTELEKALLHIGTKYPDYMIGALSGHARSAVQSADHARSKPKFVVVS
jgi:4-hydroxy-tetrahydrodipicolinate synthase